MILYGIATCDTVRKALAALRAGGATVAFRDIRSDPLAPDEVSRLAAAFGGALVNRASATWRALPDGERNLPVQEIIARHPAAMKRPVIDAGGTLHLGWGDDVRRTLLAAL